MQEAATPVRFVMQLESLSQIMEFMAALAIEKLNPEGWASAVVPGSSNR